MTAYTLTALVTGDGPLQGSELVIRWDDEQMLEGVAADVHLAAIGRHVAKWVPVQLVAHYLDATPDLPDAA
jgi:hypothetical protein